MNIRDFRVDIQPLADHLGGGFVASVPELKGCIADGETREEALQNAYEAISCWIETANRVGIAVPMPHKARRQYAH